MEKWKKILAIILELIPVISAVIAYALIVSAFDSQPIRWVIRITVLFAFLGIGFGLVGRRLVKGDKVVQAFGILACLATVFVIGFYILAIFSFGL